MNTCEAIITSGDRRGQVCCKNALSYVAGCWYCGYHKSSYNAGAPPVLCIYDPPVSLLQALTTKEDIQESIIQDVRGEENVASLQGYINIQIGSPILNGQDKIPLALISRVSPGAQNFTKKSLAHELALSINDIVNHPDVYNLAYTSLDNLYLEKITYDMMYGIFRAQLCNVS